jgi:hypothetical protein
MQALNARRQPLPAEEALDDGAAPAVRVDGSPRHAGSARLYPSHTVRG